MKYYRTVKDTSYVDTVLNIKTTIWSIGSDDAGLQSSHTGTNTTTREGYEKYDYESSCSNLDEPGVGGYQASRQEQRTYGGATLSYHYDSSGSGSYEWSGSITGSGSDVHVTDNLTSEKTYACDFTYDSSGNRIMIASSTFFFQWSGLEPVSGGSQTAYEGFWDGVSYDASRLPAYSFSGDSSFGSITDTEINVGFAPSGIPGMPSGPGVPEAINGLGFSPPSLTDEICFRAGTLLRDFDGTMKAVELFEPGDRFYVPRHDDPEGGEILATVSRVFHNPPSPTWNLAVKSDDGVEFELGATAEHPFYVLGRGWTPVHDLQPGDEFRSTSRHRLTLKSKTFDADPVPVYNIEVEEAHAYYVGKDAEHCLLVHNLCEFDAEWGQEFFSDEDRNQLQEAIDWLKTAQNMLLNPFSKESKEFWTKTQENISEFEQKIENIKLLWAKAGLKLSFAKAGSHLITKPIFTYDFSVSDDGDIAVVIGGTLRKLLDSFDFSEDKKLGRLLNELKSNIDTEKEAKRYSTKAIYMMIDFLNDTINEPGQNSEIPGKIREQSEPKILLRFRVPLWGPFKSIFGNSEIIFGSGIPDKDGALPPSELQFRLRR